MTAYWGWTSWEFDEERDLDEDSPVWVIDAKDCVPALYPIELWAHSAGCHRTMSLGAQLLCHTKGIAQARTKDGFTYISRIKLSEEEQKRREPLFRERISMACGINTALSLRKAFNASRRSTWTS